MSDKVNLRVDNLVASSGLTVNGPATITSNGTSLTLRGATQTIVGGNSNLKIGSSDAAGAGKGGQLNFTANTTSLANYPVAGIHGYHETVGAGNYSGYLSLFTTTSGGAISERLRITSAGNVGINETAPDYKLDVNGTFGFTPGASVTPVDNGDVVFELTNNTTLTVKAKGSDGVVRSGTITLA